MFEEQGAEEEAEKLRYFKTGLGDGENATKRHVEKASVLRRKKHDEKMQRLRNQNSALLPSLDDSKTNILQCKQVFLSTASYDTLVYLKNFAHVCSEQELNDILDVPLVVSLSSLLLHKQMEYQIAAADCLVNITGCVGNEKINTIGHLLLKTPFLQVIHQHLVSKTAIFLDAWKIVANIACLCHDARSIMLCSPIFSSHVEHQAGALPIFAAEFDCHNEATLPILVLIMHAFSCVEQGHEAFVYAQWKRLVVLLFRIFPEPMVQREQEENTLLELLILTIENTMENTTKDNSVIGIRLLSLTKELIPFMVKLVMRVHGMGQNRWRIVRFLVRVGQLHVADFEFQNLMREAGAIQLMCRLCDQINEPLRIEAMRWIGNYASECTTFVQHLLNFKAFDAVISYIRRSPKESVIDQAIYIMDATVKACIKEAPASNCVLQDLLIEKQFLSITVQRVGQVGCETRTLDILGMWYRLLKWNKRFVLPILEEHGGLDRVDILLGDKNPVIYKAASQIDDFIQSYGGEPQDMDERE